MIGQGPRGHDGLRCKAARQRRREFHERLRHMEQHHLHHHHGKFLQQYTYFRYIRPAGILFSLAVFYILFSITGSQWLGLLFAGLLAAREAVHCFFFWKLEKNVIKPMIKLKQGLDEVAQGNYTVKVRNDLSGDLGSVIDAFNDMTEKLYASEILQAEYEENRKMLIANISHDLKTPITAIQGYTEALLEGTAVVAHTTDKYLKIIHQNSVYVNHLIDDLFLFAKLDMQKLEFQFQCVPFKNFMDDLMEEYQLDFTEQAISFCYDNVITGEEQVKLDGKRFHQAINNILSNAVQHNANRQLAIRVRVYRQAEGVGIDISDNGPGIAHDKVPFIFDRFYRVHTERPKEMTGSGLGLAIARELIEAHGGHITVVSTLGKGTCFTIELPVWPDSEGETLCSVC